MAVSTRAGTHFCPSGQFPSLSARTKINRDRQTPAHFHSPICKCFVGRDPQLGFLTRPSVPSRRNVGELSDFRRVLLRNTLLCFCRTATRRAPLFSYSYESLFPQLLYFDNHTNCPGVRSAVRLCPRTPRPPPSQLGLSAHKSSPFTLLRTLCRPQKSQLFCNQANANSSAKTLGWVYPRQFDSPISSFRSRAAVLHLNGDLGRALSRWASHT